MTTLAELAANAPLLTRVLVGLIGGLLIVAGARWYKRGLALTAFGTGAALVATGMVYLSAWVPMAADPMIAGVAALVGGLGLVGAGSMAHRLAMVAAGALTGLVAGAAVVGLLGAPAWVGLVGLLLGALTFPWVYKQLLKLITPAVGAACLAWALGMPDRLEVLVGLWAFGAVVQFVGEKQRPPVDPEDEDR